jgi:ERG2 and Sigma1 receptor like protein
MNLLSFARSAIPILLILGLIDKYLLGTTYIFDPVRLQEICKGSISQYGNDTESLMRDIHANLQVEYGQAILPFDDKWVLSNAGGAMVSHFSYCG